MSAPLDVLSEIRRLTTPSLEGVAVRAWKAEGGRVVGFVGFVGLAVPAEMVHATGMLPFRVSADDAPAMNPVV